MWEEDTAGGAAIPTSFQELVPLVPHWEPRNRRENEDSMFGAALESEESPEPCT